MAEHTASAMRLNPDADLVAFRGTLRDLLATEFSEATVRAAMETPDGYERGAWTRLCELGLGGLHVAEEFGGSGAGLGELVVAFEELGRSNAGVPALSTTMGSSALMFAHDVEAAKIWLPRIVDGTITTSLVWPEAHDDLTATASGDSHLIHGTVAMVLDGHTADLLLVVARTPSGSGLFAVERGSGVSSEVLSTLDLTRKFARVSFDATPATLVGNVGTAETVLERSLDVGRICLAAEQLGGAEACLASAVSYAKSRYQFGRAIGSYQSIKHRCVDTFVQCESLRSAVSYAAWVADNEPAMVPRAASLAKAAGSDTYRDAAEGNVQIHGGVGFTWEHSAHLYLKRAKSSEAYLGASVEHRLRLAQHLGW